MNFETHQAMHLYGFTDRLIASGLSRWELGDLLGIHPHQLYEDELKDLADRPIKVIIELARALDMHPADLVYDLGTVLTNPRQPPPGTFAAPQHTPADHGTEPIGPSPADDAMTLLAALGHAPFPLTADQLTRALRWQLPRTHSALQHLQDHPGLAGPMAVRRVPPHAYTLAPRLDVLDRKQHQAVTTITARRDILSEIDAAALHTVITNGFRENYTDHPGRDHAAEDRLRQAGLVHGDDRHGEPVYASDDVLYSLRRTGPRHSDRWQRAHQHRRPAGHEETKQQPQGRPPTAETADADRGAPKLHGDGERGERADEAINLGEYDHRDQ